MTDTNAAIPAPGDGVKVWMPGFPSPAEPLVPIVIERTPSYWDTRIDVQIEEELRLGKIIAGLEDVLLQFERQLKVIEAGAVVEAQGGNEKTREALARGLLDGSGTYQSLQHQADATRLSLKERRIELAATEHLRRLSIELLRFETARLNAEGR